MNARALLAAMLCVCALTGCGSKNEPPMLGYVETEPTRIAAQQGGRLVKLGVSRGDDVAAGALLFALDTDLERPALDEAEARRVQSDAQATDLATGKRPAELDALRARETAALSTLQLAERDLARQQGLAVKGFLSDAALDTYRERVRSGRAQLDLTHAEVRAAELAGRTAQREAASAAIKVAEAQRDQARTRLAQKEIPAPVAARVEDTYFRIGEWVPAGSPVVSLLPAGSIKLRFYIPEGRLANIPVGSRVRVTCDGCATSFTAKVRWVATSAEFTPPVIYSKDNRAKLMFKAEAFPEGVATLAPGLPVEIRLETPQ